MYFINETARMIRIIIAKIMLDDSGGLYRALVYYLYIIACLLIFFCLTKFEEMDNIPIYLKTL